MGLPEAAGTSTERVPTLQSLPGGFGMGGSAGVRLSQYGGGGAGGGYYGGQAGSGGPTGGDPGAAGTSYVNPSYVPNLPLSSANTGDGAVTITAS